MKHTVIKIEHRLFCYISKNWQATPLIDIETVVNLISNTTTKKGLEVICLKDDNAYTSGIKISDDVFKQLDYVKIPPRETWNYKFLPENKVYVIFTQFLIKENRTLFKQYEQCPIMILLQGLNF